MNGGNYHGPFYQEIGVKCIHLIEPGNQPPQLVLFIRRAKNLEILFIWAKFFETITHIKSSLIFKSVKNLDYLATCLDSLSYVFSDSYKQYTDMKSGSF